MELEQAVSDIDIDTVEYLLQRNVRSDQALVLAAVNDNLLIVQRLVEYGTDIHFDDDKALQVAIENKNHRIVQYLLNIELPTSESGMIAALSWADTYGIIGVIDEMFESACYYGRYDTVRFLVEHGANINSPGPNNKTPLRQALIDENIEIRQYRIVSET